jgi:DNA-binding transcriptional LysR family regulator
MLDLKRLRVLCEVAERGSFSAAADSLYVSQSAISQQISALETEVGERLLLRLRGGPVLTDAGQLLVTHAEAAMARLDQAERELGELSGMRAGELRIVSFPTASATILARASRIFQERFPDVHLTVSEAEPEEALPQLRRGNVDVAIVFDFELSPIDRDRDLDLTELLEERMHLALPADHELAGRRSIDVGELCDENWLCGSSETSCRRLTIGTCEQAGFRPEISYQSNDYTVMQALIAAGMGVTLLPDLALMMRNPDIAVVGIDPEPPIRRVWAATLEAGARSTATDAMVGILGEVAAGIGAETGAGAPV